MKGCPKRQPFLWNSRKTPALSKFYKMKRVFIFYIYKKGKKICIYDR